MIAQQWNAHNIRAQRNSDTPCRRPDIMYFVPEIYGGQETIIATFIKIRLTGVFRFFKFNSMFTMATIVLEK